MAKVKAAVGETWYWVAWLGESKIAPDMFDSLDECKAAYPGAADYFSVVINVPVKGTEEPV